MKIKHNIKKLTSTIITIFMCISMILVISLPVLAVNDEYAYQSNIERNVSKIRDEIPDAEIRVVDNAIHVVVDDINDVPWFNTNTTNVAKVTSVYSNKGGTFREFDVPWYEFPIFTPFSQVYMNKDVVDALKLQMTEPEVFDWIVEQIGLGLTTASISRLAAEMFGVTVPSRVITAIAEFLYMVVSSLEYWSLKSAQDNSSTGKVSVVRGIAQGGVYQYIYSPWNSNICDTYLGYEANWYEGEYAV